MQCILCVKYRQLCFLLYTLQFMVQCLKVFLYDYLICYMFMVCILYGLWLCAEDSRIVSSRVSKPQCMCLLKASSCVNGVGHI